jgi:hypothetical protein
MTTPIPIEKTDADLHKALTGYHRLRWVALGCLSALIGMAVVIGGSVIYHQQRELDAQQAALTAGCNFFTDLAKLPVNPVPPLKRPSPIIVSLVVDSRISAIGLGCPAVPPPSATLKKWAAYYHIPLRLSS